MKQLNVYRIAVTTLSGLLIGTPSWVLATGSETPTVESAEQRMMRDFGLIPEVPPDLEPVRIEFDGGPVPVLLGVDVERRLVFEEAFRIGIDPAVADLFQIEIYDTTLLMKAHRAVNTRARIQLASGVMLPLDLQVVTGLGPAGPLEIVLVPDDPEQESGPPEVPDHVLGPDPSRRAPGYVDLTRHAIQQFYAPPRLRTGRPGLREVPLDRTPLSLIRGVRVRAVPLFSREEAGLTVTTLRIENREPGTVRLDPRQIVGKWRSASFYHQRLAAGGSTVLTLISDVPFRTALGLWQEAIREVSRADASPVPEPEDRGEGI